MLSRNKNKKADADGKTPTEARTPISNEWINKVRIVNLAKYHTEPLFNQIVGDVFSMLTQRKIEPFVSVTYPLGDVNKAVKYIQRKKCLGKVLVETAELKAKRTEANF